GGTCAPRAARDAASSSCGVDRALAALSPSRELENTHARNALDDGWTAAAVGAVGRAQCPQRGTRAISRAALRGNGWRCHADRLLRVDENLDVPFSRCVSLHVEIALA